MKPATFERSGNRDRPRAGLGSYRSADFAVIHREVGRSGNGKIELAFVTGSGFREVGRSMEGEIRAGRIAGSGAGA